MVRIHFKFVREWGLVLIVACTLVLTARAQKDGPVVGDVLKAAGEYLLQYSQKLQAVAAEEEYLQMDTGGSRINHTRRVSSDVVMVGLDRGQVVLFRDAYAIDTKSLRDRNDRLLKLFSDPPGPPVGPLQYGQRYTEDSVRSYVTPNLHVLDSPFSAFELMRAGNQIRTTFKLDSVKGSGDDRVALLRFKENGPESLVVSPSIPATGRIWVSWPSGAIRQTELIVSSKLMNLRVAVTLGLDSGTGLWLPKEMSQFYDISQMGPGGEAAPNLRESSETHLNYTKYHQVLIDLTKMR